MDRVDATSQSGIVAASAEQAIDWERVYRELLPKVYRFFCYRVGDALVAEDLTATTFERAWSGRKRYRRDLGAFSGWLFGIARRVAADHFRSHRFPVRLEEATSNAAVDPLEETIQKNNDFERLASLLGEASQREREIISLKYGGGLTNRAIARLLGLSESNVGTILHRVVNRVRDEWEER